MQTPILSRRSFIKVCTVTVVGQAGMSLASALEPKTDPNPFQIEHVGSDDGAVGDGLRAGKMGKMHWRQRLVTIDGVAHLLVLRWRMASTPDLIEGTTADRWESNYYFLCQVRAMSSPEAKPPKSAAPYMSYDGKYFDLLLADAGGAPAPGHCGTSTVQVTTVDYSDEGKPTQMIWGHAGPCSDSEEFYPMSANGHRSKRHCCLVLASCVTPGKFPIAKSVKLTLGATAAIMDNKQGWRWEGKPQEDGTLTFEVPEPWIKLGEVVANPSIGFRITEAAATSHTAEQVVPPNGP